MEDPMHWSIFNVTCGRIGALVVVVVVWATTWLAYMRA